MLVNIETFLLFLANVNTMFGFNFNFSQQKNKQEIKNTQISTQELSNNSEIENVQDYVTYVRLSTRNTRNLVSNAAINLKAAASVSATNQIKLKACNTGSQLIKLTQSNDVVQTFKKKFDGFLQDIATIKSEAEQISKTETTGSQGSSADLDAFAKAGITAVNSEDNKQKAKNEGFGIGDKQISPIKMANNVSTMLNNKNPKKRQPTYFDRLFEYNLKERFKREMPEEFCLYMCAGTNIALQESEQSIENRQISNQILYNQSKITQGIHSAYTKLSEIVNAVNKATNTNIDDEAIASITASNVLDLDLGSGDCAGAFNAGLDITQQNTVKQEMVLDSVIKCFSESNIEDKVQAYMMDMMQLTQDASASMKATAENTLSATNALTSSQVAENTIASGFMGIIMAIVMVVVVVKLLPMVLGELGGSKNKSSIFGVQLFQNLYTYEKRY